MIDVKVIFGNNIKKLRTKLNLNQEQFSEKISIASTTLSIIESGKGFTTSETINNICNEFKIYPSLLFEGDSKDIISNYGSRKEVVKDISLMLNNLDDDKLKLAVNFIQMLGDDNLNVTFTKK